VNLRPDLAVIAANVAPGASLLDVGCGDGTLMEALRAKGCDTRGMELDPVDVGVCVGKGLSVIRAMPTRTSRSIPTSRSTTRSCRKRCRRRCGPTRCSRTCCASARRAFVSFPNFAHWRVRVSLLWGGRMPVTRLLPIPWYATPNIHHLTVNDFRALVADRGIKVEGRWFLSGDRQCSAAAANFRAEHAVFLLSRD